MGNAFLKPEYAEQFNVGLKYARSFMNIPTLRMIDASVDAYHNLITDKIIAYPKGQQFPDGPRTASPSRAQSNPARWPVL